MNEFPSLHPLVTHFPIVLLLLAPLAQFAGMIRGNRDLGFVALFLAFAGFAAAFVAANFVHPHTIELSLVAQLALQRHELFASLTVWTALAATLSKALILFSLSKRPLAEYAVLLLLMASAIFVGIAGHYGARLTHVYGVGPEGNFLAE